jgi:hypothetical protein
MAWSHTALPATIMAIDVAGFNDPARTDQQRMIAHQGMYRVLEAAAAEAEVPLARCRLRDSGDGALIILPPDIPKINLVDRLPPRIAAGLRRHNGDHSAGAALRLRVALHAGEVRENSHGFVGEAVNFTFRILDAPKTKQALTTSGADFVLVLSDWFYRSVVLNDPAAEPAQFEEIDIAVKETRTTAWTRLFGLQAGHQPVTAEVTAHAVEAQPHPLPLDDLRQIVDVLVHTPGFTTREGRDLVLEHIDSDVTSMIARHSATRTDITSIVLSCSHYPGALAALIEAIRFFANGSDEMSRLDRLVVKARQAQAERYDTSVRISTGASETLESGAIPANPLPERTQQYGQIGEAAGG